MPLSIFFLSPRAVPGVAPGRVRLLLALGIALGFAVLYCQPVWDGDYYWHVHTGKWIAENGRLPSEDPFKYTYESVTPDTPDYAETQRMLRANWLGDLALYGLHRLGGEAGVMLLRSFLYGGILLLFLRSLGRGGAGPLGHVMVILLGILLSSFTNERPQLFSFLLLPLLLYGLQKADGLSGRRLAKRFLPLCLMMLVWANTHGSFLLGAVLLGLYAVARAGEDLCKGKPIPAGEVTWAVCGIAVTLLNPNHWGLLSFARSNLGQAASIIHEYASTITALPLYGFTFFSYWLYLLFAIALLALRCRRMRPWEVAATAALMALSLTALRHMPLLLLGMPLLIPYVGKFPSWHRATAAGVLVLLVFGLWFPPYRGVFQFRPEKNFPVGAAGFLAAHPTRGRLFNLYEWGGYLAFRLPGVKVFLDGRNTVPGVSEDYNRLLLGPNWRQGLAVFGIDAVALPALNPIDGRAYPLALSLANAEDWALVFWDESAMVFVRNTSGNAPLVRQRSMPKTNYYLHVDAQRKWMTAN